MFILYFLFLLSLLIFVHEFSHFLAARRLAIKVEKFSLGFGPAIFKWKSRADTEYLISLVPFGGYVKLAGEDFRSKRDGKPWEFLSRPPGERALVLIAGPIGNYLLAILIFTILYVRGFPGLGTRIGELIAGYPAQEYGLKVGDRIIAINGHNITTWEELTRYIYRKPLSEVKLKIIRNGKVIFYKIRTRQQEVYDFLGRRKKIGLIGIKPDLNDQIVIRYNLIPAFWEGLKRVIYLTQAILTAIGNLILGRISFKESLSGPIGIFYLSKEVVKLGGIYFFSLIAVISISLSIFNLLPIPVLDGGHLLFLAIEKIRKKPLSPRTQELLIQLGMVFILLFALYISYNDILRFFKK